GSAWRAGPQHRWRRAVVQPSRNAGHLPAHRGDPPTAGRVDRSGRRSPLRRRPRQRWSARHPPRRRHRHPRKGLVVTAPAARPLPGFPEPDSEPFWQATREHRLLYQVRPATGEPVFYPRRSTVDELEWRESAGSGTIYSFTVIRQHGQPYFRGRVPYVVGFI